MRYCLLTESDIVKYEKQILEMMFLSDNDFIPPLSLRKSTTQMSFDNNDYNAGIKDYFNEMKKQKFMACIDGDVLVSFVSYKENYSNQIIGNENLPNIYISTLIMRHEYRGQGITKKLYSELFDIYADCKVFTRTWSTNIAHIKILEWFGFKKIMCIENDRGNKIDTVYFCKD